MEITRLLLGLLIAFFHKPIADFVMYHERQLVVLFRRHGVPMPVGPTTETGRNIYFGMGIILAMFELVRIWMLMHSVSGPISIITR